MNSVNLSGRIVNDLQSKSTPSGITVLEFRIAVARRKKDEQGNKQADFFDVVVWRQSAEYLSTYGDKGLRVELSGRLEQQTWPDKESGAKRSKVVVIADQVSLLDRAKDEAPGQPQAEEDYPDFNPFAEE